MQSIVATKLVKRSLMLQSRELVIDRLSGHQREFFTLVLPWRSTQQVVAWINASTACVSVAPPRTKRVMRLSTRYDRNFEKTLHNRSSFPFGCQHRLEFMFRLEIPAISSMKLNVASAIIESNSKLFWPDLAFHFRILLGHKLFASNSLRVVSAVSTSIAPRNSTRSRCCLH